MKTKSVFALVCLAVLSIPMFVQAGARVAVDVTITETSGGLKVVGTVGNIHMTEGDQQYLFCVAQTNSSSWFGDRGGYCYAMDKSGNQVMCIAESLHHDTIRAIGPDSYVDFLVNSEGYCDVITVINGSFGLIKTQADANLSFEDAEDLLR